MPTSTIPLPDDAKQLLEGYASFRQSRLTYVALWFSVWAACLGGVLGILVYEIFQPCSGCSLRPDPEHWPIGAAIAVAIAAPVLWIVGRSLPEMWVERRKLAMAALADLAAGTAEAFEISIGERFLLVQPDEDVPGETLDAVLIILPLDSQRTIVLSLEDLHNHGPHELDETIVRNWRGVVLPNLRFLWDVEHSGGPLPRETVLRDEGFGVLETLDDPGIDHAPGWVIAKQYDEVAATVEKTLRRE